jgi:capsular polysaccharide transport system ATP-binding protein
VLSDLTFDVPAGTRLAVMGRNGQGKSTLIRILGGVVLPTAGRVDWGMSCSWPLGFSGGFSGSLTGLDNILFVSRIYKRPPEEIIEKTDDFAELGRALTQEIKYYSTGMRARLAFGLSLAIDFDCYLIDEVISVGDASFQTKCDDELFNKRANKTFIVATHNFHFVKEKCDRALVIESGRGKMFDDVDLAIDITASLCDWETDRG